MPEEPLESPSLADLREGDSFVGFYVVRESSLQTAVNGKNYIRMTIADATAALPANMWDATRDLFQLAPAASVIKIQGMAESYKGKMQVKIGRLRPAHASEFDLDSFLPRCPKNIDDLRNTLLEYVGSIKDNDYRALAEVFFQDKKLLDQFSRSPAARDIHHAYLGGLLDHTISMARMAEAFSADATINRDLLLIGVLVHDIGKTEELSAGITIEYTNRGKLLGHLYIGAEMVAMRSAGIPNFPREKLNLVQHLILSHHGRYEYGSPVLPKIPEAFALHHLDNLDAKVVTANRLLDGIQNPESNWTDFSRALDTALYREQDRDSRIDTGKAND